MNPHCGMERHPPNRAFVTFPARREPRPLVFGQVLTQRHCLLVWCGERPYYQSRVLTNALSCLNSGADADSHHSNNTASAVEIVAPLLDIRSIAV